uniref:NADH dehydrogenase subunit 5 n=1 Tax=Sphaeromyxa zaharoni TaxID=275449 RepID=UPI0030014FFE
MILGGGSMLEDVVILSYCLSLMVLLGMKKVEGEGGGCQEILLFVHFLCVVLLLSCSVLEWAVILYILGGSVGSVSILFSMKDRGNGSFVKVGVLTLMLDVFLGVLVIAMSLDGGLEGSDFYKLGILSVILFKSCFFLFGFWIYEAMDASYFISCFLHSSGVVFLGIVLLFKFSIYFNSGLFFWVKGMSLLGIVFNLILFFLDYDYKKQAGRLTCVSYNMMFLLFCIDVRLGVFYFIVHSFLKSIVFYLLANLCVSGIVVKSSDAFLIVGGGVYLGILIGGLLFVGYGVDLGLFVGVLGLMEGMCYLSLLFKMLEVDYLLYNLEGVRNLLNIMNLMFNYLMSVVVYKEMVEIIFVSFVSSFNKIISMFKFLSCDILFEVIVSKLFVVGCSFKGIIKMEGSKLIEACSLGRIVDQDFVVLFLLLLLMVLLI